MAALLEQLAFIATAGIALAAGLYLLVASYRHLFFPRLILEDVQGPENMKAATSQVRQIIEAELHRLTVEGAGNGLKFVSGPDVPVELPKELSLPSQFGFMAALVSWLPGRSQTLHSTIISPGSRGMGLSLTLSGARKRAQASQIIWENDHGLLSAAAGATDVERCQRLAVAGAAWVAYQMLDSATARVRSNLVTQSWESFAEFLVGARFHSFEQDFLARDAYIRSLNHDPSNRAALFNLGLVDVISDDLEAATTRFAAVREIFDDPAFGSRDRYKLDRLWYRATFNLARARAIQAREVRSGTPGRTPPLAIKLYTDVATTADEVINDLGGRHQRLRGGADAELVRFLVTVRARAVAALAELT